jgi:ubiquinone/menaquinone biosynthesis C-methylase UbiE
MYKGQFKWRSSVDEQNLSLLNELNAKMALFYNSLETRVEYDKMIAPTSTETKQDEVTEEFLKWVSHVKPNNILEIGCGSGRIRQLLELGGSACYTGTEVSVSTLKKNPIKWPDSRWLNGSVYDLDFKGEKFDLVFSFYVLEHLLFPEKALNKMYDLVSDGGHLVVICPDFSETLRLPSQYLGFSKYQSAKEKIKKSFFLDSIVSLIDSRFRLRRALKQLKQRAGEFLINANPICLDLNETDTIWPDCDAVYLANKTELEFWAKGKNIKFNYPRTTSGIFKEHIFIVFSK